MSKFTPELLEKLGIKVSVEADIVTYKACGGKIFWHGKPDAERVHLGKEDGTATLYFRKELV